MLSSHCSRRPKRQPPELTLNLGSWARLPSWRSGGGQLQRYWAAHTEMTISSAVEFRCREKMLIDSFFRQRWSLAGHGRRLAVVLEHVQPASNLSESNLYVVYVCRCRDPIDREEDPSMVQASASELSPFPPV